MKSTPEEIRHRFDKDVDRFSNLETGQSATLDAPLVLDLITESAAATNSQATHLLDIGCGAGNYTLKLLQRLPHLHCTLLDLSLPMLTRARERLTQAGAASITTLQSDIRDITLPANHYDIILAAAILHHLRTDDQWHSVFTKLHSSLKPTGSLFVSDLITHDNPYLQQIFQSRYGQYLTTLKDSTYRDHVFAYIEKEDTPRSLNYQLNLLHQVGFSQTEILHKNSTFAAYCAIK